MVRAFVVDEKLDDAYNHRLMEEHAIAGKRTTQLSFLQYPLQVQNSIC